MKTRLHYWRRRRFLSMQGLADRAQVSKSTIYLIEKQQAQPRHETAEKLARALGITLDDLLGDEDQETKIA